jgi:hypothetical protein
MYLDKLVKQKRSLGAQRKTTKTKPKSPEWMASAAVAKRR